MRKLTSHPWVEELLRERDEVQILDVCGGTGVGGIALGMVLREKGKRFQLTVLDLRRDALEKARKYSRELLGLEAETIEADAREMHRLGLKADIALLYGLTTPHFSPWDMVRFLASTTSVVGEKGVLAIEESDRFYTIALVVGYRHILAERTNENHIVLSIHAGYNFTEGVIERVFFDLVTRKEAKARTHMWSLAVMGAMAWTFYREVDFLETRRKYVGFVLARRPRAVNPEDYAEDPPMRTRC